MNYEHQLDLFGGYVAMYEKLLADVTEARWAEQPHGLPNHPAWTLGHLCVGHGMVLSMLGGEAVCPATWAETMNIGTTPVATRENYPAADELWDCYRKGHDALDVAVRAADEAMVMTEMPVKEFRSFFPTVGHLVTYMLCSHEPTHYGQLQGWKRAAGLMG